MLEGVSKNSARMRLFSVAEDDDVVLVIGQVCRGIHKRGQRVFGVQLA